MTTHSSTRGCETVRGRGDGEGEGGGLTWACIDFQRDNLMENDIIVIDLLVYDEKEDNRVRNNKEIEIELMREDIMMKRGTKRKGNMLMENLR